MSKLFYVRVTTNIITFIKNFSFYLFFQNDEFLSKLNSSLELQLSEPIQPSRLLIESLKRIEKLQSLGVLKENRVNILERGLKHGVPLECRPGIDDAVRCMASDPFEMR